MKVFYISPIGKTTPQLFDTFLFDKTEDIKEADVVFFDYYSGVGQYDQRQLDYICDNNKFVCVFDFTDFGGMSKERGWWERNYGVTNQPLKENYMIYYLAGKKKLVCFVRKLDKIKEHSDCIYPIEHIIQNEFEPVSMDELYNRPYEICWIGNSSPTRRNVVNELSKHFKVYVHWTDEKGKLPHDEWLNLHRQAKFFLSADGGGFSDERPYQLFSIAPMIKNINNHLQLHPFDGICCRNIHENITSFEIKTIQQPLNDKRFLYDIYKSGIAHMKEFYTAEYRANYILKTLAANGIN